MPIEKHHTGLYERVVGWITEQVKPYLHRRTEEFVKKAIDERGEGNPHFASILRFEIERRGKGAGLTQDVAEPLLWTGIKTAIAVPIAVIGRFIDHDHGKGKFTLIGYGAALAILLNNAVEVLRVVPRFIAGLQGSQKMAEGRIEAIKNTGIDPFNNRESPRQMNVKDVEPDFAQKTPKKSPIVPTSLIEQAEKPPLQKTP